MKHFPVICAVVVSSFLLLYPMESAQAVIISTGDGTANTTAPFESPGWVHVTGVGAGTGVYLGNQWMITAYHVGLGIVNLNGTDYTGQYGSERRITNPTGLGLSANTDLRMFRLRQDPGLPALSIVQSPPGPGSEVTMIGRGTERGVEQIGWKISDGPQGTWNWAEVPLPIADRLGYSITTSRDKRWGKNIIEPDGNPDADNNVIATGEEDSGDVIALVTSFDSPGLPNEAHGTPGDSGGGVFTHTENGWELAGIMVSANMYANQPDNTAVFGNQTFFADLTQYRSQILEVMNSSPSWQNPSDRFDVNNDGTTGALDALILINEINAHGSRELPYFQSETQPSPFLYDVNGDEFITPIDVLNVINRLNAPPVASNLLVSPDRVYGVPVPEPSTWILALGGVGGLLGLRRWNRRR